MNRKIRHIAMMILLLMIGAQNGAWADVTYHVLTLPYTTYSSTANVALRTNIRVEAIKCTSSATTVGLPSAYQTPLMNSSAYSYYYAATDDQTTAFGGKTHSGTLYGSNATVYTYYDNDCCTALTSIAKDAAVPDGVTDIYVIYDYNSTTKTDATLSLDLSGGTMYNITMENSGTLYFYGAHYKQSWGNRTENVKASNYTEDYLDCLASNDMVKTNKDSYGRNLGWYLKGNDPYNIRLVTGYTGDLRADNRCPMKDAFIWAQVNPGAGTSQSMWLFTDTLTDYRNMQNLFVSFLLLNHNNGEDYTMIGSNLNSTWGPNGRTVVHPYNGKYFHLQHNTNDTGPRILPVTPADATPLQFYEVRDYKFNVTTPFYNSEGSAEEKAAHTVSATKKWSDYGLSASMTTDDVPDGLKRKYTSFDALYTDYAQTSRISTYAEAHSNSDNVYVTYNLGTLPFDVSDSYSNATWYEMKDNAEQWLAKIRYNESGTNEGKFTRDLEVNTYNKQSEFAFIGDPYELRIINRYLSETNTRNYYVGSSGTLNEALTASATVTAGYQWEIVSDNTTGSFVLRQFNSYDDPRYWEWQSKNWSGTTDPLVYYKNSTTHRIYVNELPKYQYSYFVIDSHGRIAAKATVEQTILDKPELPSIIYSPFLRNETVTYNSGTYEDESGVYTGLTPITEMPGVNYSNIYVQYTLTDLGNKSVKLNDTQSFNVQLNGKYIYYKNEGGTESIQSADALENTDNFKWQLLGSDPYAMKIKNVGANKYVTNNQNNADGQPLHFIDTEPTELSLCIAKGTSQAGVYEVMFATGNSFDASYTYFNIGRSETDGVKEYSNSTYASGYAQLRFILYSTESAKNVTYHLIDHQNNDLLTVVNRHVSGDTPQFPSEYWSPLVKTYHYYASKDDFGYNSTDLASPHYTKDGHSEISTINTETHENIYVTYETGDLVDLSANTMYLMEYEMGTPFYAENGLDGFDTKQTKAPFYPYCNGDNNFFVYGQDQYDLQQQGAASTRTRWAWYPESDYNDPYHVKIKSRQTSPYSGADIHAYFHTHKPVDYSSVITTLTWPSASGVAATEYMILGSEGQYQLVTTYGIDLNNDGDRNDEGENVRQTLKSFEQYWKTFDTIKKNIFGLDKADDSEPTTVPETTTLEIPSTSEYYPYKNSKNLRQYLTDIKGYHNYEQWAYAKRWNGYNPSGKKSKGWEKIEHWFQTVAVGEGYFNFIEMTIDPALILLDQHGWEIMRRPLPNSPDDPDKDEKYAAIRPFNSPMVDKYYFWTKTSKRSGCHQYYELQQQVTVDGKVYTSSSLTDLPPYATATNIKDSQGNLLDQYVTYVAKEEYAYSYDPSTKAGDKFLLQQGGHYVSTSDGTTITKNDVPSGGMTAAIISAGASFTDAYLWYLKPNADIDKEMGYDALKPDWTNDYASDTSKRSGFNSNGFDPYNIQISSVSQNKYFTTNATGATLAEGVMTGTYTEDMAISLASAATSYVEAEGHDHTTLKMTNQTFMAVQDANGNMQLMPRFDHANRMTDFSGLATPQTNPAGDETGTQTTLLFRPYIYNYIIVDNQGRESLRYQSAGELTPQTPDHFQSPLATDYGYYKTLTSTGTGTYNLTTLTDSVSSFAKLSMTDTGINGNTVYVRYEYDEDADDLNILKGKWLTMELNGKDAIYDSGIKYNESKPETVDNSAKAWQWKFLKNNWTEGEGSYLAPDPYAVEIYNRSQKDRPMSATTYTDVAVSAQTTGDALYPYQRFALLSHSEGGYAMAVAGTKSSSGYYFLNGDGAMAADVAAKVSQESGFTSTSATFTDYNSQLLLNNDVENTYTYKVITNAGAFAVESTQTYEEAYGNSFVPTIPTDIQSPLLPTGQYLYYENATLDGSTYTVTDATKITTLYGLYEDYLYVRYNAYNRDNTEYLVPNKRNEIGTGQVAVHAESNDATLDINGSLLYNIIWEGDKMMYNNSGSVDNGGSHILTSGTNYVWTFEGSDPYAIKIKHKSSGKYANGTTTLQEEASAGKFMLLNKDDYDYGVLQVTGGTNMLSGYGQTLTTDDPTKFIIFALSMGGVKYHLVINKIGTSPTPTIPKRTEAGGEITNIEVPGTTRRNLTVIENYPTAYPINDVTVTTVSLGDKLAVPSAMFRPNCWYFYYIEGIYSDENFTSSEETLNNEYQGLFLENEYLMSDPDLLGKYIKINVVYKFDTRLTGSNKGGDFVKAYTDNLWYTFDAYGEDEPYLAQYTNAWGLKCLEGRASRYTNDYLWSPVGDPYGFVMYNRYMVKNSGSTTALMTTVELGDGRRLFIATPGATGVNNPDYGKTGFESDPETKDIPYGNEIYELLTSNTAGHFRVHPVANTTGDSLFVKRDETDENFAKLSTTGSEWTFGLDISQLKPYFDRTGYVGGLKKAVYEAEANKALVSAIKSGTMTYDQLVATQKLVYDDSNIQPYASGYYRLHSQPDIPSVTTPRYASGYLHEIEKTTVSGGIPMHFYSREGVTTTFGTLGAGFTSTAATRGQIPIPATENDPSTIFYFPDNDVVTDLTRSVNGVPTSKMMTQDLYAYNAAMTSDVSSASTYYIMDIGGATLLIHDGATPKDRKYLCFDQRTASTIYDLQFKNNTPTDDAKWCMVPADTLGLTLELNTGGDGYYYGTLYAPFDVLLPEDTSEDDVNYSYKAYICTAWDTNVIYPKAVGESNTGTYAGNDRYIPAGTPVIIRGTGETTVTATISTTSPAASPLSCVFSGQYLEQLMDNGGGNEVYTFGLPFTSNLTKDGDYNTTGKISAPVPTQASTGVGFYINANLNKENGAERADWVPRNNRYVLHNKIYYRAEAAGSRNFDMDMEEFVPVIFDFDGEEEESEEETSEVATALDDDHVYDMSGRCVASGESVLNGSWRKEVEKGIYILGGKKYIIR